MAEPKLTSLLPEALKGKYIVIDHFTGDELSGTNPLIAVGKFPKVNLSTLTEQSAINLTKQGFPILVSKDRYDELQAAKQKKDTKSSNLAPAASAATPAK